MIGLGLGVAVGHASTVVAAGGNPNLLRWTEVFENAVWVNGGVTVTPNAALNPSGSETTADRVVFDADGAIQQSSTTAAASGAAASLGLSLTTSWQRYEIGGSFDGLPYTFSIYLKGNAGGEELTILITRAGGVLVAGLLENASLGCTAFLWGAQLEQAGSASAYQARTT